MQTKFNTQVKQKLETSSLYMGKDFWEIFSKLLDILPYCHDVVTSPIFLMRLHISQSLEPSESESVEQPLLPEEIWIYIFQVNAPMSAIKLSYECLNRHFTLLVLEKSFPNQTSGVCGPFIDVPCPFPSLKGIKWKISIMISHPPKEASCQPELHLENSSN